MDDHNQRRCASTYRGRRCDRNVDHDGRHEAADPDAHSLSSWDDIEQLLRSNPIPVDPESVERVRDRLVLAGVLPARKVEP